tara:strand:+ start:3519 stop:4346 length:828 start_codon:yes stop_codon:yes gene_type:complete
MLRSGFGSKTNKAMSGCQNGKLRLPEKFRGGADSIIRSVFGTPSLWFDAIDGVQAAAIQNPVCKIGAMTQATANKRAALDVDAWLGNTPALVFDGTNDAYSTTSLDLGGTPLASLYTTLKNAASDIGYAFEYTIASTSNNGCYISINTRNTKQTPFALNGQAAGFQEQYLDQDVDGTYGVLGASFNRTAAAATDKTKSSWLNQTDYNAGDANATVGTPPNNNFDASATSYIGARQGVTTPITADIREVVAYAGISHSETERYKISVALAYKAKIK